MCGCVLALTNAAETGLSRHRPCRPRSRREGPITPGRRRERRVWPARGRRRDGRGARGPSVSTTQRSCGGSPWPAADGRAQQRVFDLWRRQYNHERPHEALKRRRPATVYTPSPRNDPRPLVEIRTDPFSHLVRVDENGLIRLHRRNVFNICGSNAAYVPRENVVEIMRWLRRPTSQCEKRRIARIAIAAHRQAGCNRCARAPRSADHAYYLRQARPPGARLLVADRVAGRGGAPALRRYDERARPTGTRVRQGPRGSGAERHRSRASPP